MPSFCLVLLDLEIFRAVTDEVPIFMATSTLERELFIVKLLEMGPVVIADFTTPGESHIVWPSPVPLQTH